MVTRTATELVFQQLGLCADLAADGTSAMDQLLKRDYDLILMVRRPSRLPNALQASACHCPSLDLT